MIATHETLARPSHLSTSAAVIFAVPGLIDVALTRRHSAVLAVPASFMGAPVRVVIVEGSVITCLTTPGSARRSFPRRPSEVV